MVDILRFRDTERDVALVAFIHIRDAIKDDKSASGALINMDETLQQLFSKMRADLEQMLPRNMIPTGCIPLSQLPLTAGGKLAKNSTLINSSPTRSAAMKNLNSRQLS